MIESFSPPFLRCNFHFHYSQESFEYLVLEFNPSKTCYSLVYESAKPVGNTEAFQSAHSFPHLFGPIEPQVRLCDTLNVKHEL